MDIYSQKNAAVPQKLVITTLELVLIALSAWVMFGGGETIVAGFFGFVPAETAPAPIKACNLIAMLY
ncbi:hypothetical protein DUT91_23585 [Phyllobacterium salinisoli]|uniref:Uncharacterized protein n=1 Tax=Phyllobacterium salinisoli TaxID=1899321 RepID=A0A368JX42_9HYPH|nr:hypothetical protein [Phyllobacterium salinisoli]RCS21521.1 hypothetical protein DUT91_23585 [Phyllobacterium salinisoli]